MHIETERCIIRYFQEDDFRDFHEIFSDPVVMENTEPPYDEAKSRAFLEGFCIRDKKALALEHKAERKVFGYILFSDRLQKDVYEIGWIFNRNYWRQGFAYEAMSAVVDFAFRQLHAHKLFAEAIDTVKSVGLMKKLGMVFEGRQIEQLKDQNGEWRDLYYYGLLAEQYEKRN